MNAHQNDFCLIWQYWFAVAGVMSDRKQRKTEGGGDPSNSPLTSVFDSSQLSGSIIVQGGKTTSFPKLPNMPALQASIRPEKKPLNTILDF